MRQYIFKRLLLAIPTLIGVSMIVFFMLRVLPGDLVQQVAGDNEVTPEFRAQIETGPRAAIKPAVRSEYFDWLRRRRSRSTSATRCATRSSISDRLQGHAADDDGDGAPRDR